MGGPLAFADRRGKRAGGEAIRREFFFFGAMGLWPSPELAPRPDSFFSHDCGVSRRGWEALSNREENLHDAALQIGRRRSAPCDRRYRPRAVGRRQGYRLLRPRTAAGAVGR